MTDPHTPPPVVDWAKVAAIVEGRGGRRHGGNPSESMRGWELPSPTGGTLFVEVWLRPRWCMLLVERDDRHRRDPDLAGSWFAEHVWPVVDAAVAARPSRNGIIVRPIGTGAGMAGPIARDDLPGLLADWLDADPAFGLADERNPR